MRKIIISICFFCTCQLSFGQWELTNDSKLKTSGEDVQIVDAQPELELFDDNDNRIEGGLIGLSDYIELYSLIGEVNIDSKTEIRFKSNLQERARMLSNGNWGYGITNPKEKIHLNGDIRFQGGSSNLEWYDTDLLGNDIHEISIDFSNPDLVLEVHNAVGDIMMIPGVAFKVNLKGQDEFVVAGNGDVGIGTNAPTAKLDVRGDVSITGEMTAASDLRLKKDIQPIEDALIKIDLLNPVEYNFSTEKFPSLNLPKRRKMGLIAQEVETLLPNLVSNKESENFKSISYLELIPLMIKSIQELNQKLDYQTEQLFCRDKEIKRLTLELSSTNSIKGN